MILYHSLFVAWAETWLLVPGLQPYRLHKPKMKLGFNAGEPYDTSIKAPNPHPNTSNPWKTHGTQNGFGRWYSQVKSPFPGVPFYFWFSTRTCLDYTESFAPTTLHHPMYTCILPKNMYYIYSKVLHSFTHIYIYIYYIYTWKYVYAQTKRKQNANLELIVKRSALFYLVWYCCIYIYINILYIYSTRMSKKKNRKQTR